MLKILSPPPLPTGRQVNPPPSRGRGKEGCSPSSSAFNTAKEKDINYKFSP